jgi:hypothetical protein
MHSFPFPMAQNRLDNFASAIEKLERYAFVRDRGAEREPRIISLTDDEALAILAVVNHRG